MTRSSVITTASSGSPEGEETHSLTSLFADFFFIEALSISWPCVLASPSFGGVWEASTTNSKRFNNFLASPPEILMRASVSFISIFFLLRYSSFFIAACKSRSRSFSSNGFNTYTWQRLSKALITSKEGFSVVAPINVMVPFSTAPSKASCWPLLKRWISSMNNMQPAFVFASSITSLTSFTPDEIALS